MPKRGLEALEQVALTADVGVPGLDGNWEQHAQMMYAPPFAPPHEVAADPQAGAYQAGAYAGAEGADFAEDEDEPLPPTTLTGPPLAADVAKMRGEISKLELQLLNLQKKYARLTVEHTDLWSAMPKNQPANDDASQPSQPPVHAMPVSTMPYYPQQWQQSVAPPPPAHLPAVAPQPPTAADLQSAVALNREISTSTSTEQLLSIVQRELVRLNHVNEATAFSALAKMRAGTVGGRGAWDPKVITDPRMLALKHRTLSRLTGAGTQGSQYEARQLANIAYSIAKINMKGPKLFSAIAKVAEPLVPQFNAQNLANTVWAFATAGARAPQLFAAVARASEQRVHEFNPQNISNMAWAYAKLGMCAPPLFAALARVGEPRVHEFNALNLANTAWAFATASIRAPTLFAAIARVAERRVNEFDPQALANTAWAFATAGVQAPQLLTAIAHVVEVRAVEFNSHNLANTAWAYAKAGVRAPRLFAALARIAEQRASEFIPQDLANTAWAYATVGMPAPQIFNAAEPAAAPAAAPGAE
jgi:hypothetical protein